MDSLSTKLKNQRQSISAISFLAADKKVIWEKDLLDDKSEWVKEQILDDKERLVGFVANFSRYKFMNALGFIVC